MKKFPVMGLMMMLFAGAAFASNYDVSFDPVQERELVRLDEGKGVTNDELQRLFTAFATSYLKSNSSYLFFSEVYRDRQRQNLKASLSIIEGDYGDFVLITIRYSFSNGYFEIMLARDSFTNTVDFVVFPSIDYGGMEERDLYAQINAKLQEVCYISRGYAAQFRVRPSISFYWFK